MGEIFSGSEIYEPEEAYPQVIEELIRQEQNHLRQLSDLRNKI